MNKICLKLNIYVFCLLSCLCFSQSKITGTVKDINTKIGLAGTISLQSIDGKDISYCFSDTNGYFFLRTHFVGKYKLRVSVLNYVTQIIEVNLDDANSDELSKNIQLEYKSMELNEVIIRTEKAIVIRKDTVVFDAKRFLKGNEQVVEDLLKLLPGVSVSTDGTVRVQGQEVEKIMIDGDDFFEHGYKLISKNMPVQPIDKVELYQRYSSNKHFKGIENSTKVAINLKLKERFERRWFGKSQAGLGVVSENRYDFDLNLINIGKISKYYILCNHNNVGFDATGDLNTIIRPSLGQESVQIGDNQSAQAMLRIGNTQANLEAKRSNISDAHTASFNAIYTLSPKAKLRLQFLSNKSNKIFDNTSIQKFRVGDINFTNIQENNNIQEQLTNFGSIEITNEISKNTTVVFSTKFNHTNDQTNSKSFFNDQKIDERLIGKNQLFDQKIVHTHKFTGSSVIMLSARYINEKTPQIYDSNQFIYQRLFDVNANNVVQNSTDHMEFSGFDAQFLTRYRANLIQVNIGNQYRSDDLDTQFLINQNKSTIAMPAQYQNKTTYDVDDIYLQASYKFTLNKISFYPIIALHQFYTNLQQGVARNTQFPFFINPQVKFEYMPQGRAKVLGSYGFSKANSTIINVYQNAINNELRTFAIGTNNFDQLSSSTANIGYTYGNWGDKSFFSTFISIVQQHDYFSTNKIITQDTEQLQQILLKNRTILTANVSVDQYLKVIRSNIKVQINASRSNFKNIVNGSSPREVINENIESSIEVKSGFSSLFNYHLGARLSYVSTKANDLQNSFSDNKTFADFSFALSKRFMLRIQTERYFFGNLSKEVNKYNFIDFSCQYKPLKSKFNLTLLGNNLLNTNTFRTYSVSDVSSTTSEFRLIPRYLLIKIDYRF